MTRREELIERLRQLATKPQPFPLVGAYCYAIAPPDPVTSSIVNFIRSRISDFFKGERPTRLRPAASEIPSMLDQYNDAFERLRNVGLDVTLEVPKNWQESQKLKRGDNFYMIIRFSDDAPQRIQLPNLIFIEAMIDFLQTGSEESQRAMCTLFDIDPR